MQARGFLLGGTSGRTTLNGEGLQHEDGHTSGQHDPQLRQLRPDLRPRGRLILHHGLKRMIEKQDNVFFYLTLLNENYATRG